MAGMARFVKNLIRTCRGWSRPRGRALPRLGGTSRGTGGQLSGVVGREGIQPPAAVDEVAGVWTELGNVTVAVRAVLCCLYGEEDAFSTARVTSVSAWPSGPRSKKSIYEVPPYPILPVPAMLGTVSRWRHSRLLCAEAGPFK
jgi:hypothetical protein